MQFDDLSIKDKDSDNNTHVDNKEGELTSSKSKMYHWKVGISDYERH